MQRKRIDDPLPSLDEIIARQQVTYIDRPDGRRAMVHDVGIFSPRFGSFEEAMVWYCGCQTAGFEPTSLKDFEATGLFFRDFSTCMFLDDLVALGGYPPVKPGTKVRVDLGDFPLGSYIGNGKEFFVVLFPDTIMYDPADYELKLTFKCE